MTIYFDFDLEPLLLLERFERLLLELLCDRLLFFFFADRRAREGLSAAALRLLVGSRLSRADVASFCGLRPS